MRFRGEGPSILLLAHKNTELSAIQKIDFLLDRLMICGYNGQNSRLMSTNSPRRRDMTDVIRRNNRGFKQIPPEAMEVIADVFLASSRRDENYPAYNEDQLDRKRQRASRAEEYFYLFTAECSSINSGLDDALDHAGLTQEERAAWKMFSDGYKAPEIARVLCITRPTAVRLLKSAARRISSSGSKLRGFGDVYRREVRRYVYHKPMHCVERPCQRLGYCKFVLRGQGSGE